MWILGLMLGGITVGFMVGMWTVDRWLNTNYKDINENITNTTKENKNK
jgi:hypothetical protein